MIILGYLAVDPAKVSAVYFTSADGENPTDINVIVDGVTLSTPFQSVFPDPVTLSIALQALMTYLRNSNVIGGA